MVPVFCHCTGGVLPDLEAFSVDLDTFVKDVWPSCKCRKFLTCWSCIWTPLPDCEVVGCVWRRRWLAWMLDSRIQFSRGRAGKSLPIRKKSYAIEPCKIEPLRHLNIFELHVSVGHDDGSEMFNNSIWHWAPAFHCISSCFCAVLCRKGVQWKLGPVSWAHPWPLRPAELGESPGGQGRSLSSSLKRICRTPTFLQHCFSISQPQVFWQKLWRAGLPRMKPLQT